MSIILMIVLDQFLHQENIIHNGSTFDKGRLTGINERGEQRLPGIKDLRHTLVNHISASNGSKIPNGRRCIDLSNKRESEELLNSLILYC